MDETSSILKFCERNMENMVRKCITKTLDKYIDDYSKQLQDLEREGKNKKVMKRFQTKLRFIAMNDDCEDLHEEFYDLVSRDIDYLDTLLNQITKLKIQLLSRIRKDSKMSEVDVYIPNKREFCRMILQQNAYTFFHQVPKYYSCYCSRSKEPVINEINRITKDVMDQVTTESFSRFFKRTPEASDIYQDKIDTVIKNSKINDRDNDEGRTLPQELQKAFVSIQKDDKEDSKSPPVPVPEAETKEISFQPNEMLPESYPSHEEASKLSMDTKNPEEPPLSPPPYKPLPSKDPESPDNNSRFTDKEGEKDNNYSEMLMKKLEEFKRMNTQNKDDDDLDTCL